MGLTYWEEMFVECYSATRDEEASACISGFASREEEEETRRQIGRELLDRPHVRQALRDREEGIMPQSEVLTRLHEIARGDMGLFLSFDDDGNASINLYRAKLAGKLSLIKALEFTEDGEVTRIELHDKCESLQTLALLEGNLSQAMRLPPFRP